MDTITQIEVDLIIDYFTGKEITMEDILEWSKLYSNKVKSIIDKGITNIEEIKKELY